MIENEKPDQAVKAVTALARFFRISLSRGKSIITVKDELEHVRNYLMIQHMRFKNRFSYTIEAEDEVLELASLKLMLQAVGGKCHLPWHGVYGWRRGNLYKRLERGRGSVPEGV